MVDYEFITEGGKRNGTRLIAFGSWAVFLSPSLFPFPHPLLHPSLRTSCSDRLSYYCYSPYSFSVFFSSSLNTADAEESLACEIEHDDWLAYSPVTLSICACK